MSVEPEQASATSSTPLSRRGFLRGIAASVAAAGLGATATACGGSSGANLYAMGKPVKGGPKTTLNREVIYPDKYVGPVASFKGPITTERARLRVVAPQDPEVGDWATNAFTKWYEKRTNVHVDWAVVPGGDDTPTKVNAMIAAGDMPDVFMTPFTPSQLALFGQDQGLLIPLDDLIDQYGVEINRVFKGYPIAKEVCTAPDGKMYSLPYVNDCFHCQGSKNRAWIYQPWLDKLGLDMPTTTDELEEVLTAFKEGDPNGNGKADEIPFTSDKDTRLDAYFMTAFLYNPDEPWLVLDDDKVDVVFNKPEWREGLKYMNRLMGKGLIAQEAITQTNEQLQKQANAQTPIVGTVRAFYYGSFVEIDEAAEHPRYRDYVALPPMKGPDGAQVSAWDYYGSVAWAGRFSITKASKIPEIALMWGDGLYELEAIVNSYDGPQGKEWHWAKEGEHGLMGDQATYNIGTWGGTKNGNWNQVNIGYRSGDFRLAQAVDPKAPTFEEPLHKQTLKAYHPYRIKKSDQIPPLYMTFDAAGAVADMGTTMNEYVKQSTANFTLGKSDPNDDGDWDDYVETLNQMGIKEYLQIYQQAYDDRA